MNTRVLYIEDDQDSQRLVTRVLNNYGYDVYVAKDGLEGVTLAREKQPHIVLMDINLPHLDGRAVTTRLRGLSHLDRVPIVALTANTSPGSREMALAAGCTGFLTKPIDVDDLPRQVEGFLRGRVHTLTAENRYRHLEQHAYELVEKLEIKVRELEYTNEQLFKLDRMKSEFITLASHELRTPLTLVSGYADILQNHLSQMEDLTLLPMLIQLAEKLTKGVSRMNEVVEEIMRGARIASGSVHLSVDSVDLDCVAQELQTWFYPVCQTRNLLLQITGFSELPLIEGDEEQLKTAVKNIIENAIKYTPDGGQIHLSGAVLDKGVHLKVQDTGIGIPTKEQTRIFEQFYVLGSIDHHSSSKSAFQGGGLGLGLTIAKGIVDAHNGRIWVESHPHTSNTLPGSTFHIWLPLRQFDLDS